MDNQLWLVLELGYWAEVSISSAQKLKERVMTFETPRAQKMTVFSHMTSYSLANIYRHFRKTRLPPSFRINHNSSIHITKCHAGQLHAYLKTFGSTLRRQQAAVCNTVTVPSGLQQWPHNCISSYFCTVYCMKHKQVNILGQ